MAQLALRLPCEPTGTRLDEVSVFLRDDHDVALLSASAITVTVTKLRKF